MGRMDAIWSHLTFKVLSVIIILVFMFTSDAKSTEQMGMRTDSSPPNWTVKLTQKGK